VTLYVVRYNYFLYSVLIWLFYGYYFLLFHHVNVVQVAATRLVQAIVLIFCLLSFPYLFYSSLFSLSPFLSLFFFSFRFQAVFFSPLCLLKPLLLCHITQIFCLHILCLYAWMTYKFLLCVSDYSVVGCWRGYLSGARCRLTYGPADATATHCLLLQ